MLASALLSAPVAGVLCLCAWTATPAMPATAAALASPPAGIAATATATATATAALTVTEPTSAPVTSAPATITPRMLVQPGALVGSYPTNIAWSPVGSTLVYVDSVDGTPGGADVLWRYDAASGDGRVLFDPNDLPGDIDLATTQWSPDGTRLLVTGPEWLGLIDAQTGGMSTVPTVGALSGVQFMPDGEHISYVSDNDLYVVSLADFTAQRLTEDGSDTVFNGALDWVYNEELATRAAQPAYAWSPDGNWLIYLRLDETEVHNDPTTDYRPIPATVTYTRYPTTGSANPVATLHALTPGALAPPLAVPMPDDAEYVLPFFAWTPDSNHALFVTVNRDHTQLVLNRWTIQSGELRALVTETADDWINEDRYAAPVFVGDDGDFLWLSERDGFMHLYRYTEEGELVRQLTAGDWQIESSAWNLVTAGRTVYVDPEGKWAWFTSTRGGPLERHIERLDLAEGTLEQVSTAPGLHMAALSGDGAYLLDQYSSTDVPPVTQVMPTADAEPAQVLATAAGPALALPAVTRESVTLQASDGTELYGQLVKPADFDPERQYPVVVHWYGGPGLQMVSDRYGTTNIFNLIERDVLYTQAGFLVWRLDNRGSYGRGHAFEAPIFGELGKVALEDQLAGINYLRSLPYVDSARIGTDGKSFGGYLTLYALTFAPEVFRCGMAGAPPTDWAYYDTIYTERYMRTPDVNPDGYAATNLVARAGDLQAAPLLIHGLDDTNVHLQNTINLVEQLQADDRPFEFVPLPNLGHSFRGDGLVAALAASVDYLARCLH